MASATTNSLPALVLVWGEDDYSVLQRARAIYQEWCALGGGFDHERIDALAANTSEALGALAKLREALQTLPFFGSCKVIWFRHCNFLSDERTANSQAVAASVTELAQELKQLAWENTKLLITAAKVDKRRVFYKTIEKAGHVEHFPAWSIDDRNWAVEAERIARRLFKEAKKEISHEALSKFIALAGPNIGQLHHEVEKLILFTGDRAAIQPEDIEAVVSRSRQARSFALGDALGERDLPKLLRVLDEELWSLKTDRQKSEIGLLYALISKVRGMILVREMQHSGWIKPERDFNRFKQQLDRVPARELPEDSRYNPLALNPYVLFKSLDHANRYSSEELARAMERLLDCNQRLVLSRVEGAVALQQTLASIVN